MTGAVGTKRPVKPEYTLANQSILSAVVNVAFALRLSGLVALGSLQLVVRLDGLHTT